VTLEEQLHTQSLTQQALATPAAAAAAASVVPPPGPASAAEPDGVAKKLAADLEVRDCSLMSLASPTVSTGLPSAAGCAIQ
jgi:hypothetical protein